MIQHSQLTDHGIDHKRKRGGYAFSPDGIGNWRLSEWELFPSELRWDDGKFQYLLKQQRPSLIFDEQGRPTHLATGVDFIFDPCCDWYQYGSGFTLVQAITTACPDSRPLTPARMLMAFVQKMAKHAMKM